MCDARLYVCCGPGGGGEGKLGYESSFKHYLILFADVLAYSTSLLVLEHDNQHFHELFLLCICNTHISLIYSDKCSFRLLAKHTVQEVHHLK